MTEKIKEEVFSDNVVKALKCCIHDNYDYCEECPYLKTKPCQENLIKDAFDLINRKDTQIAELTDEITKLKAENSRLYQENLELKDGFFQKHYKEAESQELINVRKAWEKARFDYIDLNAEWESKYMTAKTDARKELTDKFLGVLAWYENSFIETENWCARNTIVQIITELNKLTDEMEANNDEC